MTQLLAYDMFGPLTQEHLEEGIQAAPFYAQLRRIVEHTVKAIHAIPALHEDCVREEVEVYLGRTDSRPSSIRGRWTSHLETKGHRYGMVLLRCHPDTVRKAESLANKLLWQLKLRNRLCIANAAADSRGMSPNPDHASVIYMTWSLGTWQPVQKANVETIREVAREVSAQVREPRAMLEQALDGLKRPSDRVPAAWHMDHRDV
jgi:hypothetical protein